MGFSIKTWLDRVTDNPNRRQLTPVDGQANTFDVARAEGTVHADGDALNAANLNDLEKRIKSAFDSQEIVFGGNVNNGYKKYANGWMEAWGQKTYTSLAITTSWGTTLHDTGSTPLIANDYLIPFVGDIPVPQFSVSATGGCMIEYGTNMSTLNNAGGVWIVRPDTTTLNRVVLGWKAIGKWK